MCFCYDRLVGKGVSGMRKGSVVGWAMGIGGRAPHSDVFPDGESHFGKVIFLRTENRNCRKKRLKSCSKDAKKATGRLWF